MHRYSDINYVMNLEINLGIKLINKCFEEQQKQFSKDLYVSLYPDMVRPNGFADKPILEYISFEEFYKPNKDKVKEVELKESTEDVLDKVNKIISKGVI